MGKLTLMGSLAADLSGVVFGALDAAGGESHALGVMTWTSIAIGLAWGAAGVLKPLLAPPNAEETAME